MPFTNNIREESIFVLLPENLDLQSILEAQPPSFSFKIARFKYIISLIEERFAFDHRLVDMQVANPYVPLCATQLNRLIPHYQFYITYLCEMGVIECDLVCKPGEKCRGYRLAGTYQTKIITSEITYSEDYMLVKKDADRREELQQKALESYPNLVRWIDGLEFEKDAALDYAKQHYLTKMETANTVKRREKALRAHNSHIAMIERFSNPDCVFTIDDAGHRLHTKLTNLWSSIRQFISYEGHRLVSVDLSCSQPYLATALLQTDFYQYADLRGRLTITQLMPDVQHRLYSTPYVIHLKDEMDNRKTESHGTYGVAQEEGCSTRMRRASNDNILPSSVRQSWSEYEIDTKINRNKEQDIKCSLMLDILPVDEQVNDYLSELTHYIESVERGQFYEYLGHRATAITGKEAASRKKLKAMVISTLFSKNNDGRDFIVEAREIFGKVFPQIFTIFTELKVRQHSDLPILLQAIEAELFLNRIARRICKEEPGLPIFTLHDSIVTIDGYQDYVQEVMRDELYRATGVEPHFKQEEWTT